VAKELINDMAALYEKSGDSSGQAGSFLLLSQVASAVGDHQSAVSYAKNAIDIFGKMGDTGKKARALCMLANLLRIATSFQNAHKAATAAFDLCRKAGDKKGQAAAICMSATIYDTQNDFSRACYQLEKAGRIYGKIDDKKEKAKTLESIANTQMKMFDDLDDIDEPLRKCEEAAALYEDIGLGQGTEAAYLMQTLAFVLLALNKPDESLQKAKDSLNVFQLLADGRGEAAALNVLAQIHWSRSEKDKAKSSVQEALRAAQSAGDADELAWSQELMKKYGGKAGGDFNIVSSGGDDEADNVETMRMTDSTGKLLKALDCYIYKLNTEHVIFEQFVTRGTSETTSGGKSSSSAKRDIVEVASNELEVDLDWASL
jgi:tetratricopeptide (TPR) repeat protein